VGVYALGWLQNSPKLKLFVVMIIVPLMLNVGKTMLIDTMLKKGGFGVSLSICCGRKNDGGRHHEKENYNTVDTQHLINKINAKNTDAN